MFIGFPLLLMEVSSQVVFSLKLVFFSIATFKMFSLSVMFSSFTMTWVVKDLLF
jgi:hypothetical protein